MEISTSLAYWSGDQMKLLVNFPWRTRIPDHLDLDRLIVGCSDYGCRPHRMWFEYFVQYVNEKRTRSSNPNDLHVLILDRACLHYSLHSRSVPFAAHFAAHDILMMASANNLQIFLTSHCSAEFELRLKSIIQEWLKTLPELVSE
jgi:hypothetical protein